MPRLEKQKLDWYSKLGSDLFQQAYAGGPPPSFD